MTTGTRVRRQVQPDHPMLTDLYAEMYIKAAVPSTPKSLTTNFCPELSSLAGTGVLPENCYEVTIVKVRDI